jgi:putative membrane protein
MGSHRFKEKIDPMNKESISSKKNRLISLRDQLAINRTLMANERTFLAYLRTGAALLIAGITLIQFYKVIWHIKIGAACIILGILISLWGLYRHINSFIRIKQLKENLLNREHSSN